MTRISIYETWDEGSIGSPHLELNVDEMTIIKDSSDGKSEVTVKVNDKVIFKYDFSYKGQSSLNNHIQVKLD